MVCIMDWGLAVGILGVAISAATLWFVLLDRAERDRSARKVLWDLRATTTTHETYNGHTEHVATVLRLANNGGSAGQILGSCLVGAAVQTSDNPLVPSAMLPATHHDFKIDPVDTSNAWLLLIYMDSADMRFVHVSWQPVNWYSELAQDFHAQWAEYPRGWKARRRALNEKGHVGPGGAPQRTAKAGLKNNPSAMINEASATAVAAGGRQVHS